MYVGMPLEEEAGLWKTVRLQPLHRTEPLSCGQPQNSNLLIYSSVFIYKKKKEKEPKKLH